MGQSTTVFIRIVLCLLLFSELQATLLIPQYDDFKGSPYLINTTGCYLPNYGNTIHYVEEESYAGACGWRIVFIRKVSDHKIKFIINGTDVHRFIRLKCCYSFVGRSLIRGSEDQLVKYSECIPFEHGEIVSLEDEVISVKCVYEVEKTSLNSLWKFSQHNFKPISDAFIFIKKKHRLRQKFDTSANKYRYMKRPSWNILLLGMSSMSQVRAYDRLPKVVQYFRDNEWLEFKGYHKTGEDTFSNLMTLLTGEHPETIIGKCSDGMDSCRDLPIWNQFKQAGYVTAFGEDSSKPFYNNFKGFSEPPTDHYARPLFLTGDYTKGNIVCIGSRPSLLRLLTFVEQFAEAYRKDKFFGFFFTSTFSQEPESSPLRSQNILINTFKYLQDIGVLNKTFVFFFGDHGIGYGENRLYKDSYYDNRLPMLFMWVPHNFRKLHPDEYYNLQLNQHRLTTHYDLYTTLWTILELGNRSVNVVPSRGLPESEGLTEEIPPSRTCASANIDAKWCACHEMNQVTVAYEDDRSLQEAMLYVRHMAKTAKTKRCTECSQPTLFKVLWSRWYWHGDKKHYIVAFMVDPKHAAFEAKVEVYRNKYTILGLVDPIAPSRFNNSCALSNNYFCDCIYTCGS